MGQERTKLRRATTKRPAPEPPVAASVAPTKPVRWWDNVLFDPKRREINDFLHGPGLVWGWKSSSKDRNAFRYWHAHYAGSLGTDHPGDTYAEQYDCADELKDNQPLLYGLWLHLEKTYIPGHKLVRCYANGMHYGMDGSLHTDSVSPKSYTTMYYPHPNWSPNWGGETVFFNKEETDIVGSVYPRPNRLLSFMGTIPHVARGVSRTCPVLRITLMYKTEAP